jgi:predicted DNA-binding ribbon-helix-helix protein
MNVKDPENRKSSFIGFRVLDLERYEMELEAEKLNLSLSSFIRLSVTEFIKSQRETNQKKGGES